MLRTKPHINQIEIKIHKDWKKPQEYIVQQFVFNELKTVNKKKDSVCLTLVNTKTGFTTELRLSSAIIKQIINKNKETI